ncbi:hypothetical protein CTheo_8220 [Ceratobasidium theobromae]|uniref:Transmembrane protein n=1 Tax=Ceratobasidium theobromae TaxID=1582974 RepID=A0A5N5Q9J5_9AGAM|nr:hypothetical protein CTheo_8220 [Ceratobasidium theobromae]
MSSFTRLAGVAVLLLSLGFLVSALPAPKTDDIHIAITGGGDPVTAALVNLVVNLDVEAKIRALVACDTIAQLQVAVQALVVVLTTCANDLLNVGANVSVGVEAQANIVACVAAIITLLVRVCAQVSVKFGLSVVVALFAQIDVVLRLCLVNLNVCIGGIVALIANAIASATVGLLAQVQLKLCLTVLGLVGASL